MFIGPSGVGKSMTINDVTGLLPAASEEEEMDPACGVQVSSAFQSCTSKVISKGPCDVKYKKLDGIEESLRLEVIDTPGVPDTEGRGIAFLDEVMAYIKEKPPHGVVVVVDASGRYTEELHHALTALKLCFNNMLSESSLMVYVNKLPSDYTLKKQGIKGKELADKRLEKVWQAVDSVVSYILGPDKVKGFLNNVWNEQDSDAGADDLKHVISLLPSKPMESSQFRTWTETEKDYLALLNDAKSKEQIQEETIANKRCLFDRLERDICYHQREIADLRTFGRQWKVFWGYVFKDDADLVTRVSREEKCIAQCKEEQREIQNEIRQLLENLDGDLASWFRKPDFVRTCMFIKHCLSLACSLYTIFVQLCSCLKKINKNLSASKWSRIYSILYFLNKYQTFFSDPQLDPPIFSSAQGAIKKDKEKRQKEWDEFKHLESQIARKRSCEPTSKL